MALICDTGPIYSSVDRNDADHERSRQLLDAVAEQLIIPAPVAVEVDYWIHTYLSPSVLVAFLDDIAGGSYVVEELLPQDYCRIRDLCERYADADIGFVDAAVLADE